MKRSLFICMTDYQLINIINIKLSLFPNEEADILIGDYRENLNEIVDRLEDIKLFDHIYKYNGKLPGVASYLRDFVEKTKKTKKQSLTASVKNEITNILNKTKGKEQVITSRIEESKKFVFNEYSDVFGFNYNSLTSNIMELVTVSTSGRCSLHCIDEGIGSYTTLVLNTKIKVDDVYLYRPEFAVYNNIEKKIPSIDKTNKKMIEILNYIFAYKNETNKLNGKIIFFDQPWLPMPKYLSSKSILTKIFFKKRYKKHLPEHVMHLDKMLIFDNIVRNCGADNVLVKLHPRSNNEVVEAYNKYNCKFLKNSSMPWELFCINSELKNSIFVTVHSSAAGTYDFTVNNSGRNNNICIYTYLLGSFETKNSELDLIYNKYAQSADDVYIPETYNELKKILNKAQRHCELT